jgi:hypothetical protein
VNWRLSITRDLVLFMAGLALTINEAVFRRGPERPGLLVLFGAMMGLGPLLQAAAAKARSDANGNGNGTGGKP